ncbi:MAG: hypothetical protein IJ661_00745 [Lachnospiraceae bacterium]|nr:hypothetical protein [Lachnospiraceae bacterium]
MSKITIYIVVYVVLITLMLYCFCFKHKVNRQWVNFVQRHLSIMLLLLAVNTVSFGLSLKKQEADYYIKRGEPYEQEKQYSFQAIFDKKPVNFSINVPPRGLKPKEAQEKFEQAFIYLDNNIMGENEGLDHINSNLDLSLDHKEYPFDMEVKTADYSLIDDEGVLRNEEEQLKALGYTAKDFLSGIPSSIVVKLSYGDMEKEKTYDLVIFPREKSDIEKTVSEIEKLYDRKEEESPYEEGFYLPSKYKDIGIEYPAGESVRPEVILLLGFLVAGLLLLREAEGKRSEELRLRQELLQSYPWFINELVLLMGAGMQVRNVFSQLIIDYRDQQDYRAFLIEELKRAKHNFEIGMSEGRIYYELGRRLKLPCYIKVLTLLEQNVTKGSRGIVEVLEQEERAALEERMNLVKKRGEEAGTKLLGPMILLLLIVMLMIMVPAFISFM